MKTRKVLPLIFGLAFLISCGPSAEEKAAQEKQLADSIAQSVAGAIEARIQDSLANVERIRQDSLAKLQAAIDDSLRIVAITDSIAKAQKSSAPRPKQKPKKQESTPSKPEEWKAGQGKG